MDGSLLECGLSRLQFRIVIQRAPKTDVLAGGHGVIIRLVIDQRIVENELRAGRLGERAQHAFGVSQPQDRPEVFAEPVVLGERTRAPYAQGLVVHSQACEVQLAPLHDRADRPIRFARQFGAALREVPFAARPDFGGKHLGDATRNHQACAVVGSRRI